MEFALINSLIVLPAFGDRLEVLLVSLEGAAESLRQPAAVSADPGLLQSRIAENEALVDSLRVGDLDISYEFGATL